MGEDHASFWLLHPVGGNERTMWPDASPFRTQGWGSACTPGGVGSPGNRPAGAGDHRSGLPAANTNPCPDLEALGGTTGSSPGCDACRQSGK